jgi:uncharacterized integral membrane protein
MRWLARLLWMGLIVGMLVLGWWFAAANADAVAVNYVFGALAPMPLWMALLAAFGIGAAGAGLLAFYQIAKLGLVTRRYRKTVRGLEAEVHQLRNLPLSTDDPLPEGAEPRLPAASRSALERGG